MALPQPSAVRLGHFEEIGDVQQSLADVVPKALGVLWEARLRPRSRRAPALCPHRRALSLARQGPGRRPLLRAEREQETHRLGAGELAGDVEEDGVLTRDHVGDPVAIIRHLRRHRGEGEVS